MNPVDTSALAAENLNMGRGIILFSGGMDSTTLLHQYKDNVDICLSFHYGSKQNDVEMEYMTKIISDLGKEHIVIDLSFINQYFDSTLLNSGGEVPDGVHTEAEKVKQTAVPFRNGVMLSIAAGIAESRKLDWIGIATVGLYPDCRPAFLDPFNEAVKKGTYDGIELVYPYAGKDKTFIANIGKELGIDYGTTYSCYKGGDVHCGTCVTCEERKEAMEEAGIDDPTKYLV